MPGYVTKNLQRFNHSPPAEPQHAPHSYTPPKYGVKKQMAEVDESPPITDAQKKLLQQIVGVFLYYGRAIDNTILVALSDLAAEQTEGTEKTMQEMNQLLDYLATHPDTTIRFRKSDMVFHISSDASYLSVRRSRSRVGGWFYLSEEASSKSDSPQPKNNGPVLVIANILKNVVGSAAEAEIAGTYTNGTEGCPIRTALEEMGWPQSTTQIEVDNECAEGFANRTMKQNRTKAMDMRYYWILDRCDQKQYVVVWRSGKVNRADYHTKHHSPTHHQEVRPDHVYEVKTSS